MFKAALRYLLYSVLKNTYFQDGMRHSLEFELLIQGTMCVQAGLATEPPHTWFFGIMLGALLGPRPYPGSACVWNSIPWSTVEVWPIPDICWPWHWQVLLRLCPCWAPRIVSACEPSRTQAAETSWGHEVCLTALPSAESRVPKHQPSANHSHLLCCAKLIYRQLTQQVAQKTNK